MVLILARNWWALALRGLFAILFGLMAFAWPASTLGALVLLYGAYALADGSFAVAAAVVGRTGGFPWWAMLAEGLLGIGTGMVTFLWPGITLFVLLCLIAAWAIATGALEIVAAIRLRREIEGEWVLALVGALSIAFGTGLIVSPGAWTLAVVWMIGSYAIVFGVLLLALAFRLRDWSRRLRVAGD